MQDLFLAGDRRKAGADTVGAPVGDVADQADVGLYIAGDSAAAAAETGSPVWNAGLDLFLDIAHAHFVAEVANADGKNAARARFFVKVIQLCGYRRNIVAHAAVMDVLLVPAGALNCNYGFGVQAVEDISGLLFRLFMIERIAQNHGLAAAAAAVQLLLGVADDHAGGLSGLGEVVDKDIFGQNNGNGAKREVKAARQGGNADRAVRFGAVPVQNDKAGEQKNGIALAYALVQQLRCTKRHRLAAAFLAGGFIGFRQGQTL